ARTPTRPATASTRNAAFAAVTRTVRAPPGIGSVVSSVRVSRSTRFGGSSATPCETIVRAKSTGSPPPPTSGSSAIAVKALEQVGERELFERLDHDVGVLERHRRGDRVRDRDAEESRRLRGAHTVRGILERDRLVGCQSQAVERLDVQIGPRLGPSRVAVCGHHGVEPFEAPQPAEMPRDPLGVAAADDRSPEPKPVRLREISLDARAEIFEIAE